MSANRLPVAARLTAIIKRLNHREKLWLFICLGFFFASVIGLLWQTNQQLLAEYPASGGVWREGVIGTPRFVNPLLAISNPDRDLTTLIYSGLLRLGQHGEYLPDLAERYTVSLDGRQYTFFLKPNLVWQDGAPVTADDVIFTVTAAKDPLIKSPRRANWEGVEVVRVNEREIIFNLKQPYPAFLDNATLGLLPAKLWKNVSPENFPFSNLNAEAVGTGPYRIRIIKRDRDNLPIAYELTPFKQFALGQARIEQLTIKFYPSEDELIAAYRQGEIASVSAISPQLAKTLARDDNQLIATPLPRIFGVFFNQNQAKIFARAEVRRALNLLVDRQAIINRVLAGFGKPTDGPLPASHLGNEMPITTASTSQELATDLLTKNGWKKNSENNLWEHTLKKETTTLAFTLSTADTPELKEVATELKTSWEKFGAKVEVRIFESGALNQNVIRPREYETLLFGEIVGRQPNLYSFWHSSQRLDPGLNIALYTNAKVDKMLELQTDHQQVAEEITRDTPAIFLYSPDFIYLLPSEIKGLTLGPINTPAERFSNIYQWYLTTDRIWPIFNQV